MLEPKVLHKKQKRNIHDWLERRKGKKRGRGEYEGGGAGDKKRSDKPLSITVQHAELRQRPYREKEWMTGRQKPPNETWEQAAGNWTLFHKMQAQKLATRIERAVYLGIRETQSQKYRVGSKKESLNTNTRSRRGKRKKVLNQKGNYD